MNPSISSKILIGNSYPLGLIRRPCRIRPVSVEALRTAARIQGWVSFWGHGNTLACAAQVLGFEPRPPHARPALRLDDAGWPCLGGHRFLHVWVLSPQFVPGFRPAIGQEPDPSDILAWQNLHLDFTEEAAMVYSCPQR